MAGDVVAIGGGRRCARLTDDRENAGAGLRLSTRRDGEDELHAQPRAHHEEATTASAALFEDDGVRRRLVELHLVSQSARLAINEAADTREGKMVRRLEEPGHPTRCGEGGATNPRAGYRVSRTPPQSAWPNPGRGLKNAARS